MRNDVEILDVEQRSPEWREARAGLLTASNMGRLLTPKTGKPSTAQDELLLELLGSCVRPDEEAFAGNIHTQRGEDLEPEARKVFEEVTGKQVLEVGFIRSTRFPIGCSPDGLIGNTVDTATSGLEIKCPLAKNHIKYFMDGTCPAMYLGQVHGGMAVTGLKSWYFMSYCPGFRPFITLIHRDAYTERLEQEIVTFCQKYSQQYKKIIPNII